MLELLMRMAEGQQKLIKDVHGRTDGESKKRKKRKRGMLNARAKYSPYFSLIDDVISNRFSRALILLIT